MVYAQWSPARAKVQLKLCVQRLRLLQQKKTQLAKATRREVAGQLERHKIETAKVKTEGLIHDDILVELLEILELSCETLLARFAILDTVKEPDASVSEHVAGLIHAAPRIELKEMHILRDMLMSRYGREYSIAAMENHDDLVSPRITSRLVVATPDPGHVDLYLYEIAKAYNVDWKPDSVIQAEREAAEKAEPEATEAPVEETTPTAAAAADKEKRETSQGTATAAKTTEKSEKSADSVSPKDGSTTATTAASSVSAPPEGSRLANQSIPQIQGPPKPASTKPTAKNADDEAYEALAKRFAELKKS